MLQTNPPPWNKITTNKNIKRNNFTRVKINLLILWISKLYLSVIKKIKNYHSFLPKKINACKVSNHFLQQCRRREPSSGVTSHQTSDNPTNSSNTINPINPTNASNAVSTTNSALAVQENPYIILIPFHSPTFGATSTLLAVQRLKEGNPIWDSFLVILNLLFVYLNLLINKKNLIVTTLLFYVKY